VAASFISRRRGYWWRAYVVSSLIWRSIGSWRIVSASASSFISYLQRIIGCNVIVSAAYLWQRQRIAHQLSSGYRLAYFVGAAAYQYLQRISAGLYLGISGSQQCISIFILAYQRRQKLAITSAGIFGNSAWRILAISLPALYLGSGSISSWQRLSAFISWPQRINLCGVAYLVQRSYQRWQRQPSVAYVASA